MARCKAIRRLRRGASGLFSCGNHGGVTAQDRDYKIEPPHICDGRRQTAHEVSKLQRLQIFNQIMLLRICESEIESLVVAVDDIQQRVESAIVVETALVLREHE